MATEKLGKPFCEYQSLNFLSTQMKRDTVLAIRDVLYWQMFSKDGNCVHLAQSALKHLSWVEPELILPKLLNHIYQSLETLTEVNIQKINI